MRTSRNLLLLACCTASIGFIGCAERPPEVPSSAQLKSEGSDRVVYVADREGTIWVSDQGSNKIMYSSHVRAGDRVVLNPDMNQVTLNDRIVLNTGVNHAQHKVFFEPGDRPMPPVATDDSNVSRPAIVPRTASLKGEGKDRVEYTADSSGTLWVTDVSGDKVVYSGRVVRGDRLVIDPSAGAVMLNGTMVSPKDSVASSNHRVFFQAGEAMPASVAIPGGTVALPPAMVPATAVLRTESADPFEVRPDTDGTVWVVGVSDNHVVYSGRLLQGDRLSIDPAAHQLMLNSRAVLDRPIPRDRYRVYFLAGTH